MTSVALHAARGGENAATARSRSCAVAALLMLGFATACVAGTSFIEAGRVITQSGAPIDGGRIVVRDGRIEAVGKDLQRPPFSERIDATGMVVTPGFVLPVTGLGMPDAPEARPDEGVRVEIKPDVKAADEFVSRRTDHALLLEAGITTAGIVPVSDTPGIPGQISAISTRTTVPGAILVPESALVVNVATHAQWRKAVREAFEKASKAREDAKHEAGGKGKPEDPKAPLECAVVKKRPTIVFASGLAGWIAVRDALPLDALDAWIVDGPDLWTDAAAVKKAGVKILTFPVLSRARDSRFPVNRAAEWKAAGVPFAFVLASDDAEGAARLRDLVVEMVRAGCPRDEALAAVTNRAAAALGVADKVGSIEPGRRADLLFWSTDPLDPLARLERVMVAGETVDRIGRAGDVPPAGTKESAP